MKKTLIILLSVIGLYGCLKEGGGGCPGYFSLRFECEEENGDFDRTIGNDVILYVYDNGMLDTTRIISYENISNGEIRFRKNFMGTASFVAWAVPVGGDLSIIPAPNDFEQTLTRSIELPRSDTGEYISLDDIYLGVEKCNDAYTDYSNVTITMRQATCHLYVNVNDNIGSLSSHGAAVDVSGTKSKMSLDFRGEGDDSVVRSKLEEIESNYFETGCLGLLPSSEDQFLSLDILEQGRALYRIQTEYKSVPGSEITINVNLGVSAEIIIDGWRVKEVAIEKI